MFFSCCGCFNFFFQQPGSGNEVVSDNVSSPPLDYGSTRDVLHDHGAVTNPCHPMTSAFFAKDVKGLALEKQVTASLFTCNQPDKVMLKPRSHLQLSNVISMTLSLTQKVKLNEWISNAMDWLGRVCARFYLGNSTYFRAMTFFFQTFQANSDLYKHYTRECVLASCLSLAYLLEEEDDIDVFCQLKNTLIIDTGTRRPTFSACIHSLSVFLKHDFYLVEDLYDHYTKTLYDTHTAKEHQLFTGYLTLIRINIDFLTFDNQTLLFTLEHCLFHREPVFLQPNVNELERCQLMLSVLMKTFTLAAVEANEEDDFMPLAAWGITKNNLHYYLIQSTHAHVPVSVSVLNALPASFVTKLLREDNDTYLLLNARSLVNGAEQVQSLFQQKGITDYIESMYFNLPRKQAGERLLSLLDHSVQASEESRYYVSDDTVSSEEDHVDTVSSDNDDSNDASSVSMNGFWEMS